MHLIRRIPLRKYLLIAIFISTSAIFSQDAVMDSQTSEAILATEKKLDGEIVRFNSRLKSHSKLLVMRVKVLPAQTVFYKGKANGDKCEMSQDQEALDNNCLHLEVYDFIGSERGLSHKSLGAKNKTMILFFGGDASQELDPRNVPPRAVSKILSQVYMRDFTNGDLVISEITDEAPGTEPLQNNNFYLFYQNDGYPFRGVAETPSEKGVGRYNLEVVENTKSHDVRNGFKKLFYVKHLDYFDKLYTKIYSFNNRDGNKNYKRNLEVLKESLSY